MATWMRMALAALLVCELSGGQAKALDLEFSFTGSAGDTITGIIYGLTDNAQSSASDVVLLSVPTAAVDFPPEPNGQFSFANDLPGRFSSNSVNLLNGVVENIDIEYRYNYDTLFVLLNYYSVLEDSDWATGGYSNYTLSLPTFSTVPEPGSALIAFSALFSLAGLRRRRI